MHGPVLQFLPNKLSYVKEVCHERDRLTTSLSSLVELYCYDLFSHEDITHIHIYQLRFIFH